MEKFAKFIDYALPVLSIVGIMFAILAGNFSSACWAGAALTLSLRILLYSQD